jgi:imidazolonepropionase
VKLHAEQLSHLGGTALAARYGALSADHVEYATEAMPPRWPAGTVAVLLPGAFYTLHETQAPPVRPSATTACRWRWRPTGTPARRPGLAAAGDEHGLHAVPPDPGAEALAGTTRNAARALGLADCGVIAPGMRADLAIWDVADPAELSYRHRRSTRCIEPHFRGSG